MLELCWWWKAKGKQQHCVGTGTGTATDKCWNFACGGQKAKPKPSHRRAHTHLHTTPQHNGAPIFRTPTWPQSGSKMALPSPKISPMIPPSPALDHQTADLKAISGPTGSQDCLPQHPSKKNTQNKNVIWVSEQLFECGSNCG